MPHPYKTIALTSRADFDGKKKILAEIVKIVEQSGASVSIDSERCDVAVLNKYKRFTEFKGFDLIIAIGGDGTILRTVHKLADFSIPLLAVNRGTLGFLTELTTDDAATTLPKLLNGDGVIEERRMLRCQALRNNEVILTGHALNEVVIGQGAIARVIELKTFVDGTPLTTFRSDGIIIATPTGSTAYSLAAGGSILHPHSRETILTPINAHALNRRPLVVPSETHISVEVLHRKTSLDNAKVSLTFDGQEHFELHCGDRIEVTEHPEHIRFLRQSTDSFYATLRTKLRWNEERES